ncbi:hypothetical protein GQ457_08G028080 [Hibiscus cannabinus]
MSSLLNPRTKEKDKSIASYLLDMVELESRRMICVTLFTPETGGLCYKSASIFEISSVEVGKNKNGFCIGITHHSTQE